MQDITLVPIADALPELAAADYEDVRRWDAEIVAADADHDAYTGERLAKIQAKLAPVGLFGAYLRARGLNERTARHRIQVAQGRYSKPASATIADGPLLLTVPLDQYERVNHELSNANDAIKRLRARFTQEQLRQVDAEEQRKARQRITVEEFAQKAREQWEHERPEREAWEAEDERRRRDGSAARDGRDGQIEWIELYLQEASDHVPDSNEQIAEYDAEQRARFAELEAHALALAERLHRVAGWEGDVSDAGDGESGTESVPHYQ